MAEIFALMLAGGLAVQFIGGAIQQPTVQVCIPAVVDGVTATVCRTEPERGQGRSEVAAK